MIETTLQNHAERVVLAGVLTPSMDQVQFEEDIQEMSMLCRTANAAVIETFIQKLDHPRPATFLGVGKLEQIHAFMQQNSCTTLIVDAELSASQVRNIEKITSKKVIDRSQLILDIFALHAATNEAKIQVELAQLATLYPRLTHAWSHFSQQVGGIGTRGPGEKQLELDRRLVQKKMSDLKNKLKKVELSRKTQSRKRQAVFKISIVGYTNVGKSSLLNALCNSRVLVENKLFATLDTATRKLYLPDIGSVVISDTVGFLRKLPHHLVASFRSTLEVVTDSDLIMIVLDASSTYLSQHYATVTDVLKQLGVENRRQLIVINKADCISNPFDRKKMALEFPGSVVVSAFNSEDMVRLKQVLKNLMRMQVDESGPRHPMNPLRNGEG
ncbi:MAG: GTPase HflX [Chitinivibrionales bacterium]|nr:GTPase HflX [Chitinivibrionales bacterium]